MSHGRIQRKTKSKRRSHTQSNKFHKSYFHNKFLPIFMNLRGPKNQQSTGFSVGDELGFGESLGNLDGNKRRSVSQVDQLIAANSVGTVPVTKLPAPKLSVSVLNIF